MLYYILFCNVYTIMNYVYSITGNNDVCDADCTYHYTVVTQ